MFSPLLKKFPPHSLGELSYGLLGLTEVEGGYGCSKKKITVILIRICLRILEF
jgi:hypothetical protein